MRLWPTARIGKTCIYRESKTNKSIATLAVDETFTFMEYFTMYPLHAPKSRNTSTSFSLIYVAYAVQWFLKEYKT